MLQVRAVGAGKVLLDRTDELVARYSGALSSGGALRTQVEALRDDAFFCMARSPTPSC